MQARIQLLLRWEMKIGSSLPRKNILGVGWKFIPRRLPIFLINNLRSSAMNYVKFSSLPETWIFTIWTSRKSFIRLGHATDQKRHLGLIRLRIFKMRCVSVANDHLGRKPLTSDSAIRRSLWPLQCQPVALDDNEWHISKTLIQSSIQTHGQVSKKSYFDIGIFETRIAG